MVDKTIEAINKRMDDIMCRDNEPARAYDNNVMRMVQNQACKELYGEMIAEGLRTTAETILQHVDIPDTHKIVTTSDSFRIVRRAELKFVETASREFPAIVKKAVKKVLSDNTEQRRLSQDCGLPLPPDGDTNH